MPPSSDNPHIRSLLQHTTQLTDYLPLLVTLTCNASIPQHLVVPVFKPPTHYSHSMYLGGKQRERDILALFRGDLGLTREGCIYSR